MRLALAAYALLVLLAAPRLLLGRSWVDRAPGLGILAWQATGFTALSSAFLLVGLTVTRAGGVEVDLAHLLHVCSALLAVRDLGPSDVAVIATIAGLTVVLTRSAWRQTAGTLRARRQQRRLVDLVTTPLEGGPARLLEHRTPLAYCIPGRAARIVVTTGARDALTAAELDAVLHHERAHLRGRHHLVLAWSRLLRTALPLPVLRTADQETAELVEMLADDAVRSVAGRRSLARAVLALGSASPTGSMAVGNTGAERRVARLLRGSGDAYPQGRWAVAGSCLVVLALPWLTAATTLTGQCLTGA